ncbi:MAG TPA: rod shape-determining protein MreC [Candidatus Edwardsbacteria bacterium]|nr:rod shape-determining protein MreC [Candidatus Edwardsbacteria bacterium]
MPLISDRLLKRQDIAQLAALLLVCVVLLLLPAGLKQGAGDGVVRVFFAPLELPLYQFRSLLDSWRQNADLRQRLADAQLESIRLRRAQAENHQLRSLLGLRGQQAWTLSTAQITGREPALLTPDLIIDKGAAAGLARGMVAVVPQGLVGKITEVNESSSTVQTVFDPQSRVSAIDTRSRLLGVFRTSKGTQCILDRVPIRTDIKPGDTIVTSGYGQLFPYGLLLGVVDRVETNARSLIYQIAVRPALDVNALDYVAVVTGGAMPALPSLQPPALPDSSGGSRRRAARRAPSLKLMLPQIRIELPDTVQLKQERPQ